MWVGNESSSRILRQKEFRGTDIRRPLGRAVSLSRGQYGPCESVDRVRICDWQLRGKNQLWIITDKRAVGLSEALLAISTASRANSEQESEWKTKRCDPVVLIGMKLGSSNLHTSAKSEAQLLPQVQLAHDQTG
jgi:hypothetical protein